MWEKNLLLFRLIKLNASWSLTEVLPTLEKFIMKIVDISPVK